MARRKISAAVDLKAKVGGAGIGGGYFAVQARDIHDFEWSKSRLK